MKKPTVGAVGSSEPKMGSMHVAMPSYPFAD